MLHIEELTPRYNDLLVTGDKYEEDMKENGIIVANKGDLKTYQTVLKVGSSIRDIEEGDVVMLDIMHFAQMKYDPNSIKNDMDMNKVVKWHIPWVIIDDENGNPKDCLLINDRDVKFIFKGYEKNEPIIVNKSKIITS